MEHTEYRGMTVNERLFVSGRMWEFEAAVKEGDREKAKEILKDLCVPEKDAIRIVETQIGK